MKKCLTLFLLICTLTGCSPKSEEPKELTFEEKVLLLIQECIDDYNTSIAADSIIHQIDTPPLPISIGTIPQIEKLSELKPVEDDHSNAEFIGALKINEYQMVFHLYSTCDSFWQCGEASFQIDTTTIRPDSPTFTSTKAILDELLAVDREAFGYLYGIGVDLAPEESTAHPGYYEVLNTVNIENPTSIDQIKEYVETVFDKDFISQFYPEVFESESPIYIEDNGKLYSIENAPSITDEQYYNTSLIINTQETEDKILVDIVTSYGDIIDPELKRIEISKTENGYRLAGLY
ncbi:hypothetical protein [Anaerorhabdus sp.]|uniref:hypothetical protein n=1 Tax=Anaerorhabdus sp. TaxID=1872524 RepID=UPI002FC616A8